MKATGSFSPLALEVEICLRFPDASYSYRS